MLDKADSPIQAVVAQSEERERSDSIPTSTFDTVEPREEHNPPPTNLFVLPMDKTPAQEQPREGNIPAPITEMTKTITPSISVLVVEDFEVRIQVAMVEQNLDTQKRIHAFEVKVLAKPQTTSSVHLKVF
ncbi:hypothetical protein RDI58_013388 [Solanum bulbocastanum]|uniref:Uncharacterized protein n=1 Tax=Solanum bulbocastanum TaxID=147425 RepID=A0AAN8TJF7_SOLBU